MNYRTSCLTVGCVVMVAAAAIAEQEEHSSERAAHFVVDGVAKNVQAVGDPWTTENGALVCSGTGNVLYAGKLIGPGDFTISAQLTIEQIGRSAASLMINSDHFGLEGQQGEMFTEGTIFGKRNLGSPVVKNGQAFDWVAKRRGDELTVEIDGKPIVTAVLPTSAKITVGLRPWRSTMRVTSFSATGNLRDLPPAPTRTVVFKPGEEGYQRYRIPAIVRTNKGTLLAFCEGRTGGDSGPIDMVLKRSNDSGRTWGPLEVVWDDGDNTCGNPCPVVDRDTGTIWLLLAWNLGSDHEGEIMAGKSEDVRHVYVTHSDDDGKTWEKPIKISATTRKPHWRWYATGPGNAIQLTRGEHKGRLLIPCNHSDHRSGGQPYRSHVIYSDDHGKTWQLGGVHENSTNESAVVERVDGSILQAMRSYHGKNRRAMAVSSDGGKSWGKVYLDPTLDTPVCQANILRYSWPDETDRGGKSRILFSSPAGASRSRMTVWLSYDEGQTWPVSKLVYAGGSAYSNLVGLPNQRIGLLFERDGYQSISFATFTLNWLKSE